MKILIRMLFVILVISSCAIHRSGHSECEHISWSINDSCFHAKVSSFETHQVEIIKYERAYGTLYVYVRSNEKIYQVIPISFDSSVDSDTNIGCKVFNKKLTITKGDLIQLKLIPIFADEQMPGDMVSSIYLNGYSFNVQRRAATNVFWGISE